MQAGVYSVYEYKYLGMLITRKYYDMSCFVFEKPDTFGKTFALRMQRIFFFCKRVTSFYEKLFLKYSISGLFLKKAC